MNNNKIAVIGDSHVNFFGGHEFISFTQFSDTLRKGEWGINSCGDYIVNFETFHLGPALAYNLNKYGSHTKAREKIEFLLKNKYIAENQPILCSFGEIDCRVHVIKRSEKFNGNFRPVIDVILLNYLDLMKFLARENPVYIWGVIPTQKNDSPINPEIPYYGTETQRNKATEYFNRCLNEICIEHGFKFFSIFDYLIDENYYTRSEYIADGCHLSQRAWSFAADEFMKQGINITFRHDWLKNFDMGNLPIKKIDSRTGFWRKKLLKIRVIKERIRALLRGKIFGDLR